MRRTAVEKTIEKPDTFDLRYSHSSSCIYPLIRWRYRSVAIVIQRRLHVKRPQYGRYCDEKRLFREMHAYTDPEILSAMLKGIYVYSHGVPFSKTEGCVPTVPCVRQ